MTLKRILLILITILVSLRLIFSLADTISEPQVQSRLELYQTNLVLQATELKLDAFTENVTTGLLGKEPLKNAKEQYQEAIKELENERQQTFNKILALEAKITAISSPQLIQLRYSYEEINQLLDELNLDLGLLQLAENQVELSQKTWQEIITSRPGSIEGQTATILKKLWEVNPQLSEDTEEIIKSNLRGWFRDRAIRQLYQTQNRQAELSQLQANQQETAKKALIKLALIGGVPACGGLLGVGILIFLLVQWGIQKERSILGGLQQERSILPTNSNTWVVPWPGEITWQVLIFGFFFVSQIFLPTLLPILIHLLKFDPASFTFREKALSVLISYGLMMVGGLGILYLSIKPFFPLPEDWFRFKILSRWFVWGIGGYLVAIPIVVIVSLINQQIWQGQGGSNPIIFLALKSNDPIALLIFLTTASLAAPIFEETIFRGFLLPSLTRYLPLWGAIVLSSLVFAIAHLSLSEILPLTALGIVLGFVYGRSRNLLSSILLHSLWNSGTLFSLFVLGSN